jgi:hypothetical protein
VRACWSAPATLEQLQENLTALRDPGLPEERRQLLLAHGALVYQEDSTFRKLVRPLCEESPPVQSHLPPRGTPVLGHL